MSYTIKLADGCIASRHQDHIRLRFNEHDTCDMDEHIHIENSQFIKPNMVEAEQSKQETNTSETLDASSSNSPQPEIIDMFSTDKNNPINKLIRLFLNPSSQASANHPFAQWRKLLWRVHL